MQGIIVFFIVLAIFIILCITARNENELHKIIAQAIDWEKVRVTGEFVFFATLKIFLEGEKIRKVNYIGGGFLGEASDPRTPPLWRMGEYLPNFSEYSLFSLIGNQLTVKGERSFEVLIAFSVTKKGITNSIYGRLGSL